MKTLSVRAALEACRCIKSPSVSGDVEVFLSVREALLVPLGLNSLRSSLEALCCQPWSEQMEALICYPAGVVPTAHAKIELEKHFPKLETWRVTAPPTDEYNCYAWSVGIVDDFISPGSWLSQVDQFYEAYGWTTSASGYPEYKKRKIALWGSSATSCMHASLEAHDCNWHESKMGPKHRILHRVEQLSGGVYGEVLKWYEKPVASANLHLKPA
jgi:hypothetical protein